MFAFFSTSGGQGAPLVVGPVALTIFARRRHRPTFGCALSIPASGQVAQCHQVLSQDVIVVEACQGCEVQFLTLIRFSFDRVFLVLFLI